MTSHLLRIPKKTWDKIVAVSGECKPTEYARFLIGRSLKEEPKPAIERSVAGITEDNFMKTHQLVRVPIPMWDEFKALAGEGKTSEYIRVVLAQYLRSLEQGKPKPAIEPELKSEPVIERSEGHVAGIF